MYKPANLQDVLLNTLRKEKLDVTVFLTNGFQIKGKLCGYDNFVIVLETDGKQQIVYKHAISTIVPCRPIPIRIPREDETESAESGDKE
jgi:host factor-I protein